MKKILLTISLILIFSASAFAAPKTIDGLNAVEWFEKGLQAFNSGSFEQSYSALGNVVKLDEKNYQAYYLRSVINIQKNNLTEAEKDINKAIAINATIADHFQMRGRIYNNQGRLDEAIKDLSKAIDLDSQNPTIYYDRAGAYANMGDVDNAVKDFDKTISFLPKDEAAYIMKAEVLYKYGQFDKAKKAYQDILKAFPTNTEFKEFANTRIDMINKLTK